MTITDEDRHARRTTFGAVTEQYDRWRPHYPEQLFADLAKIAVLGPDSVAVEIGCGTGQATASLSDLVGTLHVVDLSTELLAFTEHKLADHVNIRYHHIAFEDFEPGRETCDLVAAASSFHWLDPDRSFGHAADMLRPGGSLAVIHPHGLSGGTPGFFEASRDAHVSAFGSSADFELPDQIDVSGQVERFAASGRFTTAKVRTYEVETTDDAESLTGVLGTFSAVLALPDDERERYLEQMATIVDREFDGRVTHRVGYSLVIATRVD